MAPAQMDTKDLQLPDRQDLYELGCSYTYKFLWDDMNKHILEKMGESGIPGRFREYL